MGFRIKSQFSKFGYLSLIPILKYLTFPSRNSFKRITRMSMEQM